MGCDVRLNLVKPRIQWQRDDTDTKDLQGFFYKIPDKANLQMECICKIGAILVKAKNRK